MDVALRTQFLTNTSETGRFLVYSQRTGKTWAVEAIDNGHRSEWGSVDPATKQLMNKKGHDKYRGAIDAEDSLITPENGFKNIRMLEPGMSPLVMIEVLDAQYPDKSH